MKMKMKALVAVTALALGAQAQAAINYDGSYNATTGDGSGELFLSVIDRANQKSYTLDLGVTAATFIASDSASYSLTYAADANLTTFLATASLSNVSWNLAAANNLTEITTNMFGYLSTAPTTLVANANTPQGITGISGSLSQLAQYADAVNATLTGQTTNYGINTSTVTLNPLANEYHDTGSWGDMWNGSHSTEGGLDDSMAFYLVALDFDADPEAGNVSRVQTFSGEWKLASNGALTYATATVTPPAVPVPAAVWLLGSALIGMVGVARRKTEQA